MTALLNQPGSWNPWLFAHTLEEKKLQKEKAAKLAEESKQIQESAYAQVELLRKRRGAASTILTGPLGVTNTADTVKAELG